MTDESRCRSRNSHDSSQLSLPGRDASFLTFAVALIMLSGCGSETADDLPRTPADEADVPVAASSPRDRSVSDLRKALGANQNAEFQKSAGRIIKASLFQSGVEDISALKGLDLIELDLGGIPVSDLAVLDGMPLETLVLEDTKVSDLSVVREMPLRVLKIQNTSVKDLSPLEGLKLRQLNLMGTAVDNLEIIRGMPLETLWLPNTAVKDLSPLSESYLVSLDCAGTPISDLSPLSRMKTLRRLNIAGSGITDLQPLRALQLERLVFSPEKIRSGMDVIRTMPSLQTLGTSLEQAMPAAQFWEQQSQTQNP